MGQDKYRLRQIMCRTKNVWDKYRLGQIMCRTNDFDVVEKNILTYGLSKPLDVAGREDDGLKKLMFLKTFVKFRFETFFFK